MAEIDKLVVPISNGQGGYTPTEITFQGGSGTWTTPVSAEAGDDTITFVDAGITENATIDIYSKNTSNTHISYLELEITSGQLEMTIEPLEEDTNFKLHIF